MTPYCYAIKSVTGLVAVTDNVVGLVGKSAVVSAVVLAFCCVYHLTEVTAFRNFALVCSTVFSVTNRASFGARTFVIDESRSEKQARRGVQIYKSTVVNAGTIARVNLHRSKRSNLVGWQVHLSISIQVRLFKRKHVRPILC